MALLCIFHIIFMILVQILNRIIFKSIWINGALGMVFPSQKNVFNTSIAKKRKSFDFLFLPKVFVYNSYKMWGILQFKLDDILVVESSIFVVKIVLDTDADLLIYDILTSCISQHCACVIYVELNLHSLKFTDFTLPTIKMKIHDVLLW